MQDILWLAWAPGPFEMALIAGVALLLFGKRLPEIARSMGKGVVEFKRGLKDVDDEVKHLENETKAPPPPPPPAPPGESS